MKKIMVVDNEPDIVDLTRTVLELGGYNVVTAHSGEECLRLLEKESVDLVLRRSRARNGAKLQVSPRHGLWGEGRRACRAHRGRNGDC